MSVNEDERVRALLHDVDFPEPRHDVGHTMRIGRRRRAGRYAAAAATGAAVLLGAAVVAVQVAPAGPNRTTAGPTPPTAGPTRPADCTVEHLALPAGVTSAVATGVDPTGRYVIGTADPDERTILWTDGQPQLLPVGARAAEAVNASGVVVGSVVTGAGSHSWVYREGRVSQLPVPADSQSEQASINTAGDIAAILSGTTPIVWPADKPGTYRVLNPPDRATARAIGDSGVIVGSVDGVGPYRWDGDVDGRPLATLPGLAKGFAVDVAGDWATGMLEWSETGPTPGVSRPPGGVAAVRWNLTTGTVTALGVDALPQAVDATGRVLIPESPPRLIGLDNVVRPLPPDPAFHRSFARGLSDTGIVVGAAATDDKDPNAGEYRSQPLRWICPR